MQKGRDKMSRPFANSEGRADQAAVSLSCADLKVARTQLA